MPTSMSNFIAVTADQTSDGHPIAVMGPQTGYDVPQFLWEFAVHSHGGTPLDFDGRGIDFAMLPYIEIGRSKNFAWSATSGESDLVDTRVSKMCNMNGSAPSLTLVNGFPSADGYVYDAQDGKGPQCRRFYERTDHWTTTPTPASAALGGASQPESVARYILRTHYGPVTATATVNGQPVAIAQQRSTFYNELTTVAPFAVASTGLITGPADFQQVFNGVTGTFNWLYIDSQHLGYIQSGLFPMRDAQQDPDLPVWGNGDYEWASDADAVNGANSSYCPVWRQCFVSAASHGGGTGRSDRDRHVLVQRLLAGGGASADRRPGARLHRFLEQQAGTRLVGGRQQRRLGTDPARGDAGRPSQSIPGQQPEIQFRQHGRDHERCRLYRPAWAGGVAIATAIDAAGHVDRRPDDSSDADARLAG